MANQDERPTPPDPHRAARPPRPAQAAPGSRGSLDDGERAKREAVSALRRVGAQRAQLPQPPYRPRQETLRDSPAPPPDSPASASLPPASRDPRDAQIEALRRERDALLSGRKPSPPGGIPAQVETTDSGISDEALGRGVRHLLKRFWPLLLGAVGLGAGGAGALKPAADPAKADAVAVELGALKRDHAAVVEQLTGVLKREPQRDRYIQCLEEQQRDIGEQVLPAPDRMASAKPPRPFVEKCSRLRP